MSNDLGWRQLLILITCFQRQLLSSPLETKFRQNLRTVANCREAPVSKSEIDWAIFVTHKNKEAKTFWERGLDCLSLDNDVVSWKFCYVLHSILRDGHPNCIQDLHQYHYNIDNLCKFWKIKLRGDYGKLDHLYYTLLKTKLNFHRENSCFPGNLVITEDLDAIVENHNDRFQLLKDIFDYMDHILILQSAIFGKLEISETRELNDKEQLLAEPLIPCWKDAGQLYEFSVKILSKLHSTVARNVFDIYHKRFLEQFTELKQFSQKSYSLSYFKIFIVIPSLPENPPNFSIQGEAPVNVSLMEPKSEPFEQSAEESSGEPAENTKFMECLDQRDALIFNLQQEVKNLRQEVEELNTKINPL